MLNRVCDVYQILSYAVSAGWTLTSNVNIILETGFSISEDAMYRIVLLHTQALLLYRNDNRVMRHPRLGDSPST